MRFSDLDGATVGVWGVGVETTSFARQLRDRLPTARIAVVVQDRAGSAATLADAPVVGPVDAATALGRCDVLVRSPGVSIHRPELASLALPVVTPTGLWMAERGGRDVVGVTATKGKSTTASLIAHLVRAVGRPVQLVGNIGRPALDLLGGDPDELAVVELSSYQVADLEIGPETAVALNLYPEHIEWHGSHETYRAEKLRLLSLPGVRRRVVNELSDEVMGAARGLAEVTTFGATSGWHVTDDGIVHDERLVLAGADIPLLGAHNALNVCAALATLDALALAVGRLPAALAGFRALPHRLEIVHDADGVLWVDDSISTTPESAASAVASFPDRPIVLIGGGVDRRQDYTVLAKLLRARDATVIGVPDTGGRLVAAVRAAGGDAIEAPDLPAAVAAARERAPAAAVVLLSPAAPSYNAYANFEARGDHFRALACAA